MLNQFNPMRQQDALEHVKQTVQERKLVLDYTLKPQKNHTLFEYNTASKELKEASFEPYDTVIKWEDAVRGLISVNRKVVKNENCIYVSALNEENAKKILRRDHQISIK